MKIESLMGTNAPGGKPRTIVEVENQLADLKAAYNSTLVELRGSIDAGEIERAAMQKVQHLIQDQMGSIQRTSDWVEQNSGKAIEENIK